jgi:hypothetical protein
MAHLHLVRSRITLVWFILVTATAASFEMGHGVGLHDLHQASIAIILIAFIKVRFVILDFMEIRNAPIPIRVVGEVWCVVVCSALIILYIQGTPAAA